MIDFRFWKVDCVRYISDTAAEICVLHVKEEAFVKQTGLSQRLITEQHEAATKKGHGNRGVRVEAFLPVWCCALEDASSE
jgi:hypothetical protein